MKAEGLILAGGQSTRMGGCHKGNLLYGDETFTQLLVKELKKAVSCVKLSYGHEIKDGGCGCPVVMDIYPECGPIGGIYAGLKACESEWMLTVACDMPLMKITLYRYLMDILKKEEKETFIYDGAVPVTDGRIHPLAGVYRAGFSGDRRIGAAAAHPVRFEDNRQTRRPGFGRKNMADILEEQILEGNYRIRDALKRLDILYVDVTEEARFVQMLRNVNTMEEYEQLKSGKGL